nr:VOC family protein [Micromonospora sp. DSM 115978]
MTETASTETASAVTGFAFLCVDSAEPEKLARGWQGVTGGVVGVDADGDARLRTDAGVVIDFLTVRDSKLGKNRLHVDLGTTDLDLAVSQALAHGAQRAGDVYTGPGWAVMRDPEGNEFCLLAPEYRDVTQPTP